MRSIGEVRHRSRSARHKWRGLAAASLVSVGCALALPIAGAATTSHSKSTKSTFNLSELVSEAESEGGTLNVWDSSSSILQIATNFEAAYPGIKVNAQKVSSTTELTKLQALAGSTKPSVDVVLFATGPNLVAQLIDQNIVKSWVPPDLNIPKNEQNPLVYLYQPAVFFYDPTIYGKSCPITNIWQLTMPKWSHLFAISDPTQDPEELEWFSEMVINSRNQLAGAYQKEFGKPYKGSNAGYTFIQDLAKNGPLVESSLDNVIDAVGGPGVTKATSAIGLAHGSTYADAAPGDLNYSVAMCRGMTPWNGYMYPKFAVETTNTTLPYEADLFIHYLETNGNEPAAAGGGLSGNPKVAAGGDGPPGLIDTERVHSEMFWLRLNTLAKDFKQSTAISQLWSENLAPS